MEVIIARTRIAGVADIGDRLPGPHGLADGDAGAGACEGPVVKGWVSPLVLRRSAIQP